MKAFLDTSVLVAAFYGDHEHHDPSLALLVRHEKSEASTAAHCLAEVYSVLTGMPGRDRVGPDEAMLFVGDVRERLTLVTLGADDYWEALKHARRIGIAGGAIYDAVVASCALRARVETIYTWNVKHYSQLGAELADRVRTP